MALNPVSLDERLRPWHLAGITYLLLPEGSTADLGTETPVPSPALHSTPPHSIPAPSSREKHPPPRHTRPVPPPATATAKGSGTTQPGRVERHSPAPPPPPLPDEWPQAWQDRLRNTPKAPLVWTYPELGDDLAGKGDKARSACLREMIKVLALPKGSSAFWPLRLPDGSGSKMDLPPSQAASTSQGEGESRYFRAGLLLLNPQALVLFGAESVRLSGLEPGMNSLFTQTIINGILTILVPDFPALIQDRSLFGKTSAYLRTSLNSLPGLDRSSP